MTFVGLALRPCSVRSKRSRSDRSAPTRDTSFRQIGHDVPAPMVHPRDRAGASPNNGSGACQLSAARILSFIAAPPGAEKPPVLSPTAITRWQGTMIGIGLRPSALPQRPNQSVGARYTSRWSAGIHAVPQFVTMNSTSARFGRTSPPFRYLTW